METIFQVAHKTAVRIISWPWRAVDETLFMNIVF